MRWFKRSGRISQKAIQSILDNELEQLRIRGYQKLVELERSAEHDAIEVSPGKGVTVIRRVLWDDATHTNLRVIVEIDPGTWRSTFLPATDDFIISPDGRLVED